MDNDLIQDTNLDLLQVQVAEVEYSGQAPINVDNQEHIISLDPSALSSKLDTSAFDEWTATHSAGQEYSAGNGIDITDHVISVTGQLTGDYLTKASADTLYQPIGDYLTTADSGNFYPMEGNPSGFLTGVDLSNYYEKNETSSKEEIENAITSVKNIINNLSGEYYPLTSNPSGYLTAVDLSEYQKIEDMTAYQEVGDYYSASNPSGFITGVDLSNYYEKNETSSKEEISNALTAIDNTISGLSGEFQKKGDYYSASNPSGFITGVDLSNYYQKNETSSKQEIGDVINEINNNITNLSGKYYPLNSNPSGYLTAHQDISDKLDVTAFTAYTATAQGTEYSAGDNINITNHVISGKDWSDEIENATTGKLDASAFNSGDFYPMTGNPSGFLTGVDLSEYQKIEGMTSYQPVGDYYSASNPSGFITGVDLSNYYEKNETSSKEEISAALTGKLDESAFTAYTATAVQGIEYTGIAPIDVNNTTHQISADVWTLSGTSGISILEDSENKVTTIAYTAQPDLSNYYTKTDIQNQSGNYYPMTGNPSGFLTAHQSLSNYYTKNDTSSKQEISAALSNAGNTAYSSLSAQSMSGDVLDFTEGRFRAITSNEIMVNNDRYVVPKNKFYNVHETVIHSANQMTAITNDLSTNFVYNNVYDTVTGQIDSRYRNYTFGNNGEQIDYDTRIDVTLPFTATAVSFTACDSGYNPIYTGILYSDVGKTDWTIEPTDFNINHSHHYYSNEFAKIQIGDFGTTETTTGIITANLINAVDEVFATQPWVLSQLTGQGAGFPITGMDGSTVYSADCNGSSFNIRSQYSTTYFAPRSLYHAHSPAYGASAEYSDIIDVANTFCTAIPCVTVANSGMATANGILYIVTGN